MAQPYTLQFAEHCYAQLQSKAEKSSAYSKNVETNRQFNIPIFYQVSSRSVTILKCIYAFVQIFNIK
jgi:hypothetical protein